MRTFVVAIVIGMLALAGAVPAAAQSKNDKAPSVGATITHDPAAERNSYTNNAQGEMRMWEQKLHDFNARLETSATEEKTNASKRLDSAWTETKTAWDQLVKVGLKVGTDGTTDWDSAKVAFETASQKFAVAWKKVNPEDK
jgi:hypothetical protein